MNIDRLHEHHQTQVYSLDPSSYDMQYILRPMNPNPNPKTINPSHGLMRNEFHL